MSTKRRSAAPPPRQIPKATEMASEIDSRHWYTAAQAWPHVAARGKCGLSRFYALLRRGEIAHERTGTHYKIRGAVLIAWLDGNQLAASA